MGKEKFEHTIKGLENLKDLRDNFKPGLEGGEKSLESSSENRPKPQDLGAAAAETNKKAETKAAISLKKEKHYIYKEVDRLGENIGLAKEGFRKAKTNEEKKLAEEKIKYFIVELEKAKEVRDRIKGEAKEGISTTKKVLDKETRPAGPEDKVAEELPNSLVKEASAERKETVTTQNDKPSFLRTAEDMIAERFKKREGSEAIEIQAEEKKEEKWRGFETAEERIARQFKEREEREKIEEEKPEEEGISKDEIEKNKINKLLEVADKQSEKIDVEIKEKSPWIREKIEKAAGWYKKQPLWKKILFSAGCLGAASASAAVGGAVGVGIATAAFTGSMGQRLLGGLATFITVEGLLKKSAEKGDRERTEWEARRHTTEAAILGVLVGSGKFAESIRNIAEVTGAKDIISDAYNSWFPKEEVSQSLKDVGQPAVAGTVPAESETISSTASITEATPEAPVVPETPIEKIIDYQGGKSIWQEAGKQLEGRFKEFADLGEGDSKAAEALRTYNIDRIKDTVVDAIKSGDKDLIEKYGLVGIDDPDKLTVDQLKGIKWDNVFEDTLKDEGLTENLPQEQIKSILKVKQDIGVPTESQLNGEVFTEPQLNEEIPTEPQLNEKISTEEILVEPVVPEMLVKPPVEQSPLQTEVSQQDLYTTGFDQVFSKGEIVEGLKNMFGTDILKESTGVIPNRGDGIMVIKNAFGQKNFDLLLTSETIGVDGPAGWNWGSKGAFLGFGDRIPTEKLNPETIKAAKDHIMESVRDLGERNPLNNPPESNQ